MKEKIPVSIEGLKNVAIKIYLQKIKEQINIQRKE